LYFSNHGYHCHRDDHHNYNSWRRRNNNNDRSKDDRDHVADLHHCRV
jgi:hypothetical protein